MEHSSGAQGDHVKQDFGPGVWKKEKSKAQTEDLPWTRRRREGTEIDSWRRYTPQCCQGNPTLLSEWEARLSTKDVGLTMEYGPWVMVWNSPWVAKRWRWPRRMLLRASLNRETVSSHGSSPHSCVIFSYSLREEGRRDGCEIDPGFADEGFQKNSKWGHWKGEKGQGAGLIKFPGSSFLHLLGNFKVSRNFTHKISLSYSHKTSIFHANQN